MYVSVRINVRSKCSLVCLYVYKFRFLSSIEFLHCKTYISSISLYY
jgi:hypothetical protein